MKIQNFVISVIISLLIMSLIPLNISAEEVTLSWNIDDLSATTVSSTVPGPDFFPRSELLPESDVLYCSACGNSYNRLGMPVCKKSCPRRCQTCGSRDGSHGLMPSTKPCPEPNVTINYKTETISLVRGDIYSLDAGKTINQVTEKRVILSVSDAITNGTAIIIQKPATKKAPASNVQIIEPVARARLESILLFSTNNKQKPDLNIRGHPPHG